MALLLITRPTMTRIKDQIRLAKKALKESKAPGFGNRKHGDPLPTLASIQKEYNAKKGKKFIKIIKDDDTEYGKSVWGFINMNHDKFEMGDVLKAAGWRAPALNKARGNLFDGYPIDPNTMLIYGPRYLR